MFSRTGLVSFNVIAGKCFRQLFSYRIQKVEEVKKVIFILLVFVCGLVYGQQQQAAKLTGYSIRSGR